MGADVLTLPGVAGERTLFLDRDGVINRKIDGDYVRHWKQFEFLPGAVDALRGLSCLFATIVVVTNQRGVGLGLMSESDLGEIHRRMVDEVERAGGRIDGVYHCPHDLPARCACRKPAPGLVGQAIGQHPQIDILSSMLVGDTERDMALARRLGIPGVLVGAEAVSEPPGGGPAFDSLLDFSVAAEGASADAG